MSFQLAFLMLFAIVFAVSYASQEVPSPLFERVSRQYPYSLAFRQMFRPSSAMTLQSINSYQWPPRQHDSDSIREIIDLLNEQDAGLQILRGRERRSAGPVFKRYACRFKFCRIFDA